MKGTHVLSATINNPGLQMFSVFVSTAVLCTAILSLVLALKRMVVVSAAVSFFAMIYFMIEIAISTSQYAYNNHQFSMLPPSIAFVVTLSVALIIFVISGIISFGAIFINHLDEISQKDDHLSGKRYYISIIKRP